MGSGIRDMWSILSTFGTGLTGAIDAKGEAEGMPSAEPLLLGPVVNFILQVIG